MYSTLFGSKKRVYADCTGTGDYDTRFDKKIEELLPFHANVHSNSFCSDYMTELMKRARSIVRQACCNDNYAVIFTGNGTTGAARHFAHLIDYDIDVLMYSVFEHLSNSTLWESVLRYNEKIVIGSKDQGLIDHEKLRQVLETHRDKKVLVAITACSNVLGVLQDTNMLLNTIRQHDNAIACLDLAACAPYIDIKACGMYDAMFVSPHKFKGGHSTPGILLIRKECIKNKIPFYPGGGTVWYADHEHTEFITNVECREEGGTPNIIGIIKTGLLFSYKQEHLFYIINKTRFLVSFVDDYFNNHIKLSMIDMFTPINMYQNKRLPIYSFRVKNVNPKMFVKLLSDVYGIQARGGVSCCYLLAEQLCRLNKTEKETVLTTKRNNTTHFGWVRLSFYYDMEYEDVLYIMESLKELLINIDYYKEFYVYNLENDRYENDFQTMIPTMVSSFYRV